MGQRGPPPLGTKSLILFVNLQNIRKIKTIRVLHITRLWKILKYAYFLYGRFQNIHIFAMQK
jgi:hypothetical protein